jgi:hypothetical protein
MAGKKRLPEWQDPLPVARPGAMQLVAIGKTDILAIVVSKVQVVSPQWLLDPVRDVDERRAVDIVAHAIVQMRVDHGIGRKASDVHATTSIGQRLGNANALLPITTVASAGTSLRSILVEFGPNIGRRPRPEAGAQRTLEGVG